jgi:hypothetical protein
MSWMEMTRFCLNKGALNSMELGSRFREGEDYCAKYQILFV